jgi:AmmeMemoRadiSam system protein B
MVPFLQHFLNYDYKIVPITISNQTYKNAKILAEKLYKVLKS